MGNLTNWLTNGLILIILWASTWGLAAEEALPGGRLFGIFVVYITSVLLGKFIKITTKTPEITGMLLAGFLLRRFLPHWLNPSWFRVFRRFARTVLMLRAGMNLNWKTVKDNFCFCTRLALLPSLSEAVVVAAVSYFLSPLSTQWSLLLGLSVASVSPAVVIPAILKLKEKGIRFESGADTFVLAAAAVENVFVLGAYSLVFSIIFASTQRADLLLALKGPLEIASGLVYGMGFGLLLWIFPPSTVKVDDQTTLSKRLMLLLLFGALGIFGGERCSLHFAGTIGCVVGAIVTRLRWQDVETDQSIESCLKYLWKTIFEPLFFGIIGTDIRTDQLLRLDTKMVVFCILVALLIRFVVLVLITYGAHLSFKERVFLALCGMPKGTVQASLGPLALGYAHDMGYVDYRDNAELIVAAAFLSILLTAPLGTFVINLAGHKLLEQSPDESKISVISEEAFLKPGTLNYHTFTGSNTTRKPVRQFS